MLRVSRRLVRARGRREFGVETLNELALPLKTTLESVHLWTGLSWPVLIPLSTIVLRTVFTAPLAVWNRVRARRQRTLQPLLSGMVPVLKAQLAQNVKSTGLTPDQIVVLAAKERRKRRIKLFRTFKCQNWKLLVLPAVQIPLFVAMSLSIRSLVGYDLRSTDFGTVDVSGILWAPTLTKPDPYGIFPLALGALCLTNVELLSRQSPQNALTTSGKPHISDILTNVSRAGTLVFTALSFQAPLGVELYWLSSNAYSLLQNIILDRYLPVNKPLQYPDLDAAVLGGESPVTKGDS